LTTRFTYRKVSSISIKNKQDHPMKKLNLKGFAHWIIPALVVVVIGAIGTYLVVGSHAATVSPATTCKNGGGVYLDLSSHNVPHGPCWSNPGAYIINWGASKTGTDGIDHVPLAPAMNAETGTNKSEKFYHPQYVIIVGPESTSRWQLCGISNGLNTCTPKASYFSQPKSAPYYGAGGAYAYLKGGAYTLSKYDYYGGNANGSAITKFSTDTNVYLIRL
jgi:hypothetical protein